MSTVGLITEYNPFHSGHKYHIAEAKRITGADTAIVIMSGNYVQRGEPSFADKYTKTAVALNNGADIVIELPYCFACAGAEYFAFAAVSILDRLGAADYLCFGAEYGNIEVLKAIAHILATEPEKYKSALKEQLKKGVSYPTAREYALSCCFSNTSANHNSGINADSLNSENMPNLHDIISSPNNILAIEYLKSLEKRKSKMIPMSIARVSADYHDSDFDSRFYSATAIRQLAKYENTADKKSLLKETLYSIDNEYMTYYNAAYPMLSDDFSLLLGNSLIEHCKQHTLTDIFGITGSLADRIENNLDNYCSFDSFALLLKTKNLNYTSVCRGLLHCLLDISDDLINRCLDNDICGFVRILGFRKDSQNIFNRLKASPMKIITSLSRTESLNLSENDLKLLEGWLAADKMYRLAAMTKYGQILPTEYTRKLMKKS